MDMENYFKRNIFGFRVGDINIAKDLDKIYASLKEKGEMETTQKGKILTFEKLKENIKITIDNYTCLIDKNPILFLNEKNKVLFKVYIRTEKNLSDILDLVSSDYEFYNISGKKLLKDEIIKKTKEIMKVIVKLVNNEYKDIFEPLCTTIKEEGNFVDIKVNNFLPESSKSLMIEHDSNFKLCISQRIELKNIMMNFINSKKYILKIYGPDGIGKSVSFLYLSTLKNDNRFIYFNLRDINKFQLPIYSYFKKAMMKYYSNYYKEKTNKENYDYYQCDIKDFEKAFENKIKYGTFWDLLNCFCDFIKSYKNSVIIIDQYKNEYGEVKIVKTLLSKYKKYGNIKFIISSSLNDYSVKEDFILDLLTIYEKKILSEIRLENIKNINEIIEEEIEDHIFDGFNAEKNSEDINNNDNEEEDFFLISEFNNIECEKEENEDKKMEKEKKDEKKEIIINKIRIEPDDILYINNLISMEEFIKDKDKELLKLFNYNPKTFTKFYSLDDSYKGKEFLHESFLNSIFNEIANKVKLFYDELSTNKYINKSSENLKGTFLLKLDEIIKNKKELNLQELIQSLEIYPFKYLKIYITDSNPISNIITLDKELINKKFILDYSYDFIEIAFSKIINMISYITLIDMNDLSGSGFGSFLENKMNKKIEKDNEFVIRYFWNFTSLTNIEKKKEDEEEIILKKNDKKDKKEKRWEKEKYIYDYKNYKKIKIEYDDVLKYKIVDFNKYYYIIPGSENNKSLDSVILMSNDKNNFDMICIQATKFKSKIKKKEEYINDCFITKAKFESNYEINIKNVYFYFLLCYEYQNNNLTFNLDSEGIEYFYYSIKKDKFLKDDDEISIKKLNIERAKIEQEKLENENLLFKNKLVLFNRMINFLQRKRRKEKNFKITENNFDKARFCLFNKTPKIKLNQITIDYMKKIVQKNPKFSSELFTFVFLFMIKPNEFNDLKEMDELIGLIVNKNKKDKKIYHYIYRGEMYPNCDDIPSSFFFHNTNKDNKRANKFLPLKNKEYLISDIPDDYINNFILIFKIYTLKKKI